MKKIYVKIDGIHCRHCESKIITALLKNHNVKEVTIQKNIAHILCDEALTNQEIIDTINSLDYITKEEYISDDLKRIDTNMKLKEFVLILMSIIIIVLGVNKIFGFNILNVIPTIDSNITYGMLVITGMLTSIHCIGMCGAINLMAVVNENQKPNLKMPLLYNIGRILSYTLIGGMVGFIGSVISINETVRSVLILIAAFVMLLVTLNMLGMIQFHLPKPPFQFKKKSSNAFVIGLLNGFMPCGPLQAMQVYALSTGSFITGALSMFLFGIGTVPLMLFVGVVFNLVKGRRKIFFNKVASVFILILTITMINRGFLGLGIDVTNFVHKNHHFTASIIKDDYQEVEINLSYSNYEDIMVVKDIPVKLTIHVDKKYLTGCNNELVIHEYGIKKEISSGDNVIEFLPNKVGTFTMTCWMNMIKNQIKVIDGVKG